MATKRKRGTGSWEFTIRRKGLLPKPISLTFYNEAEGDAYVEQLEKLLDRGIVPAEFKEKAKPVTTLGCAISTYLDEVHVTDDDVGILNGLYKSLKERDLSKVNYPWAEEWVKVLRVEDLAPSTIRKKVGALARCLDWVMRREDTMLSSNPLRVLPKRYSTTSTGKKDQERDRRLLEGEDPRILSILNREKPEGRERPLALPHADELRLMFIAALESAMRMRETYTLTRDQINLKLKTIFLDKTKNGDKRQVPISSVLYAALENYLTTLKGDIVFSFWDGSLKPKDLRATSSRLSQQWARIFSAAGCMDLCYHDLRHEATSRLFERTDLSDIEIAKITGHSDPKVLMRYANLRGSNLAGRMW